MKLELVDRFYCTDDIFDFNAFRFFKAFLLVNVRFTTADFLLLLSANHYRDLASYQIYKYLYIVVIAHR